MPPEPAFDSGDPWIDAYLTFRQELLAGKFEDFQTVCEYLVELRRDLPEGSPSIPAAIFITRDLNIAFPETFPATMDAVWVPRPGTRRP